MKNISQMKKSIHFSLEISFTSVKSPFIRSKAVQKPHLEEFGARAWPVHFFPTKTLVSRPSVIGLKKKEKLFEALDKI